MATIRKSIETDASATEMKSYINLKVLSRSELQALFDNAVWHGDTLHISSKLGNGTIALFDKRADITIELSLFGSVAKKTLENVLDKELQQLSPKK
jgi:hypothetical protein